MKKHIFILAAVLWASLLGRATAAPITVFVTNTNGDKSPGSLGGAITQVNANPGGGVIDLSPISGGTINLTASLPDVSNGMTFLGSGVTVNGAGGQFLDFLSGSVSMSNLFLAGGMALSIGGGDVGLTNANSYGGGTTVGGGGRLNVGLDASLGAGAAVLTLDNGILRTSAGVSFDLNRGLDLTPNNGTFNTNGFDSSWNGVISGSGTLSIIGGGALTLTGANTYSGGTYVGNGSVLSISSDIPPPFVSNLGSTSGSSMGAVTLDNGTLQTGVSVLNGDYNRPLVFGPGNGTVNVNGGRFCWNGPMMGSGGLTVTDSMGTGGILASYGLNTYTGATEITPTGSLYMYYLSPTLTSAVDVNGYLYLEAELGTSYFQSFGSLKGASSGEVELGNYVGLIVGSDNQSTTFLGTIESSNLNDFGLAKVGTGTLSLRGVNTYTGGTTVSGGILNVTADSNLGAVAALTILTPVLTLDGGILQTGAGVSFDPNRWMALTSNSGTFDTKGFDSSWNGPISGVGNLSVTGGGALTLNLPAYIYWGGGIFSYSGNIFWSGNTSVLGGTTLSISDDAVLGGGNALTLDNGTLQNNGANGTLSTGRQLTLGTGGGTLNTVSNTLTNWGGAITGTGVLNVSGPGTLLLSSGGSNTYTGGTHVGNSAILAFTTDGDLGALSGNVTLDGGTLANWGSAPVVNHNLVLASKGGTLDVNGNYMYIDGVISGSGGIVITQNNGVTVNAGCHDCYGFVDFNNDNTYTGGTLVTGYTLLNVHNDASFGSTLVEAPVTLMNGILQTKFSDFQSSRTLVLQGGFGGLEPESHFDSWNGLITGPGLLEVGDEGALTITNGGNNYSGGTSIWGDSTLVVRADGNLGAPSGTVILRGGTLQVAAGVSFNPSRDMTVVDAGAVFDANGFNSSWNGTISGDGAFWAYSSVGSGSITLANGNNSYEGGTAILGGAVVSVSRDGNLGDVAGGVRLDGGMLQVSGGVSFDSARGMTLVAGNGWFDTNGHDSSWNGEISGTGGLKVVSSSGSGALTLTDTGNSYSGGTSIGNRAEVVVGADGQLGSGLGAVELNGGTLQTAGGVSFSSARNMVLGSGNGWFDTAGHDSSWNGDISGSGGLALYSSQGDGALTLTQPNSYLGATDITEATLVLRTNGTLPSGTDVFLGSGGVLDLGAMPQTIGSLGGVSSALVTMGGTLTVGNGLDTLYTGVLSGSGGLKKVGSGMLALDGVNTYSGGTEIAAGTLVVGTSSLSGAVLAGSVTVDSGAVLEGFGTVGGKVTNNNLVAIPAPAGALSITQLEMGAGATAEIGVLPGNNNSSRFVVGGADLNGSLTVTASLTVAGQPVTYGIRYKYLVLSSGSPLSGVFSSVSDSLPYMTPTLVYGPQSVTLILMRNTKIDFTVNALTGNQFSVGTGLNQSLTVASDGFFDKLNEVYLSPPDQQRTALNQMGGSSYAPLGTIMLNEGEFETGLLMDRFTGEGWGSRKGTVGIKGEKGQYFWVEEANRFGNWEGNTNVTGYGLTEYALMSGYKGEVGRGFEVGWSLGYHHLDMDMTGIGIGKTTVVSYLPGVYGSLRVGRIRVAGVGEWGWDQYQGNRAVSIGSDVSWANSRFEGDRGMGAVRLSMDLAGAENLSLEPLAGMAYSHITVNGFKEKGAESLNLTVGPQGYDSFRPVGGMRAGGKWEIGKGVELVPEVEATLSREIGSGNTEVTGQFEGAPGVQVETTGNTGIDPLVFSVSGGVKATIKGKLELYGHYRGDFGAGQNLNSINGGLDVSF